MKTYVLAIIAVALMFLGFMIAWGIYRPKPPKPEPPAPAVRQKDGSLELERAPSGLKAGSSSTDRPLKPAQEIPKGAKVERIVEVTVNPKAMSNIIDAPAVSPGGRPTPSTGEIARPGAIGARSCPPVTVDLSLVRMPDKSQRVLASSPDGEVVGGIDVPVQAQAFPRIQRWSISALAGYDSHVGRNVFGGQASYSKGPFVVSGGIIGGTAFVGAGIKF